MAMALHSRRWWWWWWRRRCDGGGGWDNKKECRVFWSKRAHFFPPTVQAHTHIHIIQLLQKYNHIATIKRLYTLRKKKRNCLCFAEYVLGTHPSPFFILFFPFVEKISGKRLIKKLWLTGRKWKGGARRYNKRKGNENEKKRVESTENVRMKKKSERGGKRKGGREEKSRNDSGSFHVYTTISSFHTLPFPHSAL